MSWNNIVFWHIHRGWQASTGIAGARIAYRWYYLSRKYGNAKLNCRWKSRISCLKNSYIWLDVAICISSNVVQNGSNIAMSISSIEIYRLVLYRFVCCSVLNKKIQLTMYVEVLVSKSLDAGSIPATSTIFHTFIS